MSQTQILCPFQGWLSKGVRARHTGSDYVYWMCGEAMHHLRPSVSEAGEEGDSSRWNLVPHTHTGLCTYVCTCTDRCVLCMYIHVCGVLGIKPGTLRMLSRQSAH